MTSLLDVQRWLGQEGIKNSGDAVVQRMGDLVAVLRNPKRDHFRHLWGKWQVLLQEFQEKVIKAVQKMHWQYLMELNGPLRVLRQ